MNTSTSGTSIPRDGVTDDGRPGVEDINTSSRPSCYFPGDHIILDIGRSAEHDAYSSTVKRRITRDLVSNEDRRCTSLNKNSTAGVERRRGYSSSDSEALQNGLVGDARPICLHYAMSAIAVNDALAQLPDPLILTPFTIAIDSL